MSGRSRAPDASQRGFAQHFLASPRLARELVEAAGVAATDRVLEFGGGTGVLTAALAARAAQVLTVELDPKLAVSLARQFDALATVTVMCSDALEVPLPSTSYRVVANIPFNRTGAILRRLLDDPRGGLVRADLIVQWQVARARVAALDLLGATWGPWWMFERGRRLPAALFRPSPSVDAAVLTVTRREHDLIAEEQRTAYTGFVRREFEASSRPLERDVEAWVRLFRLRQTARR